MTLRFDNGYFSKNNYIIVRNTEKASWPQMDFILALDSELIPFKASMVMV